MSRQSAAIPKSKTLDNKYMLGDEIGKGAYGRVYKGLDLENGDFVAIKKVSLENIAQEDLNIIMQEIDLLKNLRHKNIVKYLGSSKTKTHLHIILEYVENGSLANIIKPTKFGPFPESLVAVYIVQVLEGLVYLHEQGVIHRDIKGANILLTKEGLVKLADFGVATKLTEADVNTHSVVGTPYWMAPEVIEMSGVCAESDIWSVGCTVIELLTCVPPYYDLQPMPALFRIVQDERPPIPDSLSPAMMDFLCQCFKKDARQRPDAKTLLSHPWIQNSRRVLQSSLRHSETALRLEESDPVDAETMNKDDHGIVEDANTKKAKDSQTDLLSREANAEIEDSSEDSSAKCDLVDKRAASHEDEMSDQVSTSTLQEKLPIKSNPNSEVATISADLQEPSQSHNQEKLPISGELGSPNSRKKHPVARKTEEKGSSHVEHGTSAPKIRDYNLIKAPKASITSGANELSKFSDTPGDASLEDLFRPLDKTLEDQAAEASTSASSPNVNQGNAFPADEGRNVLATKLRAAIAKKRMENELGRASGGDLLRIVMGVLKEDATGTDGLGFDDNMPADNLFHLQAVEFSKLVSSLRPNEPEDVVVSACQKITAFFHQRPEQKYVFITQHGLLPLMELLENPRTGVMCAVLQVLNQIIKDKTDYLENACLVGFIPVVMSFAEPDHPREIRMEAAYFLQQLYESSSLTLHMFIACRGIPILVGFLEADYAKYREMVHLAIDGIWKVLKLQRSPRNDFCRIAAKNGILPRLTNTLYSLNEATRLAVVSGGGVFLVDGITLRSRSVQLDPGNPTFGQCVAPPYGSDHPDYLRVKHGVVDDLLSSGTHDSSQASVSHSSDSRSFPLDTDRPRSSTASIEGPDTTKSHDLSSSDKLAHGIMKEKSDPSRTAYRISTDRTPTVADGVSKGLDPLKADFSEVTGHGREHENLEPTVKSPPKIANRNASSSDGTTASTSGLASQTASSVLSDSGVSNARPVSAASSGLLSHMAPPWSADVTWEYVEKVADLLLEFAGSDTTVKSYMCRQSLLTRLFLMFNKIEHAVLLKLLKCVNHLSTDPHCLENLQRADAIKFLIPNLDFREGPLVSQIHHEVLNALFNLCKINKRRQEQAAENGIIPHLMYFIMSASPLKQYALPLLCDMAHASRNSREQLRAHGGLDVYLSLLDDELWSVTALDSIAVCLAHDDDTKKVEQSLLKKEAVQKLVNFFRCCPEQHFLHILEPFLKMITKSPRINTTLAVNGLTQLLISRLEHQDAITRLNLLKLIKAVYEHHPRPKQMIVDNDLPQKLQNLIEERRDGQSSGGQVLVKQMATSLLKALHINTVL